MLSQLEFKLSVEKQYKAGIEKMVRLYQDEGDRKSRQDAEGRRIESNQKVQLLKQALKRYEDLHVDTDSTDDVPDGMYKKRSKQHPSIDFFRRQFEHTQYEEAPHRTSSDENPRCKRR